MADDDDAGVCVDEKEEDARSEPVDDEAGSGLEERREKEDDQTERIIESNEDDGVMGMV